MKTQNVLKLLVLSLVLSSCGLIEKWKTPEQPTDSNAASAQPSSSTTATNTNSDDLFSGSMNEKPAEETAKTDAPSNVNNDELKQLEDEFSGNTSQVTAKEKNEKNIIVEEAPVIKTDIADSQPAVNPDSGKVMTYKVQKGETLMLIAFKLYGDISKWKELKALNGTSLSKNSALRANMALKYHAPEKEFVWNPEGTPYLIKNGETLGTISNTVYQTPKKWKKIWENNKPLIKNPNVIYAGFTLYYKNDGMANYVQPKTEQKKIVQKKNNESTNVKIAEEVKVEEAISKGEEQQNESGVIDLTKDVQSAPVRDLAEEIKLDNQAEEAIEN